MTSEDFIYWEQQRSDLLCAVHCLNSLLQGPVFTEIDLGEIGQRLDEKERGMGTGGGNNVSMDGFFGIQVIIEALAGRGVRVSYLDVYKFLNNSLDPTLESGLIFNRAAHWQSFRKIRSQWYDLNSCSKGPALISEFGLSTKVEGMIQNRYTVLVARGGLDRHSGGPGMQLEPWQRWVPVSEIKGNTGVSQPPGLSRCATSPGYSHRAHMSPSPGTKPDLDLDRAIALSLQTPLQPPPAARLVLGPEPSAYSEAIPLEVILLGNGRCLKRRFLPNDTVVMVSLWLLDVTKRKMVVLATDRETQLPLGMRLDWCGLSAAANVLYAVDSFQ